MDQRRRRPSATRAPSGDTRDRSGCRGAKQTIVGSRCWSEFEMEARRRWIRARSLAVSVRRLTDGGQRQRSRARAIAESERQLAVDANPLLSPHDRHRVRRGILNTFRGYYEIPNTKTRRARRREGLSGIRTGWFGPIQTTTPCLLSTGRKRSRSRTRSREVQKGLRDEHSARP